MRDKLFVQPDLLEKCMTLTTRRDAARTSAPVFQSFMEQSERLQLIGNVRLIAHGEDSHFASFDVRFCNPLNGLRSNRIHLLRIGGKEGSVWFL